MKDKEDVQCLMIGGSVSSVTAGLVENVTIAPCAAVTEAAVLPVTRNPTVTVMTIALRGISRHETVNSRKHIQGDAL